MIDPGMIRGLQGLSDNSLDASMRKLIGTWSDPPTSLQVLEVLDRCIFSSLCSGWVIIVLRIIYDERLKAEGMTHEENEKLATWRDQT